MEINKKGDDTMASIAKPANNAFVLDKKKASKFMSQNTNGAEKALKRFFAHKPKDGIVTPEKK